jgi:hypothetical protein
MVTELWISIRPPPLSISTALSREDQSSLPRVASSSPKPIFSYLLSHRLIFFYHSSTREQLTHFFFLSGANWSPLSSIRSWEGSSSLARHGSVAAILCRRQIHPRRRRRSTRCRAAGRLFAARHGLPLSPPVAASCTALAASFCAAVAASQASVAASTSPAAAAPLCSPVTADGWALSSKRMDPPCCSTLLCRALL